MKDMYTASSTVWKPRQTVPSVPRRLGATFMSSLECCVVLFFHRVFADSEGRNELLKPLCDADF